MSGFGERKERITDGNRPKKSDGAAGSRIHEFGPLLLPPKQGDCDYRAGSRVESTSGQLLEIGEHRPQSRVLGEVTTLCGIAGGFLGPRTADKTPASVGVSP